MIIAAFSDNNTVPEKLIAKKISSPGQVSSLTTIRLILLHIPLLPQTVYSLYKKFPELAVFEINIKISM
jgi:hypothetical protein